MPRVLLLVLVTSLVGCSGSTLDSGPASDTRARPGTPKDSPRGAAPTNTAGPKSTPNDTPQQAKAPHTAEGLRDLIAALRDPDEARRVSAAKELGGWGKDAARAAGPLAAAINTGTAGLRQAALGALEAIFPDLAPDLHALVADEDPAKRVAAEKHLAALSPEAGLPFRPIIDWRIASLPDEARKANVGYAPAGEEFAALAPLLLKWGVDSPGFRAVVGCATVSPEGGKPLWEPAQLTLCELARNETFRKEALAALDSSLSSRPSAATLQAVGGLGPDAKSLGGLLETLATDRDPNVRKAAAEALQKVRG
jgi:hypothetical protein